MHSQASQRPMVGRGLWPADCDGWALTMPADCDGWALLMPADCDGWALVMASDCIPHQVLGAAVVRIGPPVRAALCASSGRPRACKRSSRRPAPLSLSPHRYAPPVLRQVVPAHASAHHGALSLSLPTGTRHPCFVRSCACFCSRAVASPSAIAATCRKSSGSACFDACTAIG